MKKILSFFTVWSLVFAAVPMAQAGECYSHQSEVYSGTGTIKSGVYLRDKACMEGSSTLGTLSGGTAVQIHGHNDGWYQVSANGIRGWIYGTFLTTNASQTGPSLSYWEYDAKYPSAKTAVTTEPVRTSSDSTLLGKTRGYILLQVEQRGEAWYVDPITAKRYYMKDGPTAYQMMRSFGLGVSEKDYESMKAGNLTLKSKLRGRIMLRAEAKGEAYYIHPKDLKMYYLQNGEEAYKVMRLYSLGVTDADLNKLSTATIPLK